MFGDDKLSLYKYRDDWNKELKGILDLPKSSLTQQDLDAEFMYKDIISVLDEIIMEIP